MHGYDPTTYGEHFADVYDDWYTGSFATGEAVDGLVALADGGPVLELGVGTGRLAIPLAERGLEIWGLDASPAMLERLAAKPGGSAVQPVLGDLGAPLPGGPYALVFVAYNTFFALPSEEAQTAAFAHIAAVLRPGGRFALEAFVPADPAPTGSSVELRTLAADRVVLSVHRADPERQLAEGSFVELTEEGGVRLRPWSIRYATPDQLDRMARSSGFDRDGRHAGWDGTPFTESSAHHVSIYRKPM